MNLLSSASWTLVIVVAVSCLSVAAQALVAGAPGFLNRRSAAGLALVAACSLAVLTGLPRPAPAAWTGDYQTGDLSQWDQVHVARPEGAVVVPAPSDYPYAGRFTVAAGDRTFGQTEEERAEVMASQDQSNAVEGATTWHGWSSLFPRGTAIDEGGWLLFSQWHHDGDTCPQNVAFYLTDDDVPRVLFAVRGGDLDEETCTAEYDRDFDLGVLPTGRWIDFRVKSTWSSDPSRARMEVEMDGRQVLPPTHVANLYTGQGAYFKQGIYRSNMARTSTIYHAGTARGATESSIPLRACHGFPFPLDRRSAWC